MSDDEDTRDERAGVSVESDPQEYVAGRWEGCEAVKDVVALGPGLRIIYKPGHSRQEDQHAYTSLVRDSGWVVVATSESGKNDVADVMPLTQVVGEGDA